MPAHLRTQISAAAAATLAGLATTGANVFRDRRDKFITAELPALNIAAAEESVEAEGFTFPPYETHSMALRIEAIAAVTGGVADTLNQIAKEVAAALFASLSAATFGGLAAKAPLLESVDPELTAEAELPIGQLTLIYRVVYCVSANAPDTPI